MPVRTAQDSGSGTGKKSRLAAASLLHNGIGTGRVLTQDENARFALNLQRHIPCGHETLLLLAGFFPVAIGFATRRT